MLGQGEGLAEGNRLESPGDVDQDRRGRVRPDVAEEVGGGHHLEPLFVLKEEKRMRRGE